MTLTVTRKVAWYAARRHLGLTPAQWEALPWNVQRLYLDGLFDEGLLADPRTVQNGQNEPTLESETLDTQRIDGTGPLDMLVGTRRRDGSVR